MNVVLWYEKEVCGLFRGIGVSDKCDDPEHGYRDDGGQCKEFTDRYTREDGTTVLSENCFHLETELNIIEKNVKQFEYSGRYGVKMGKLFVPMARIMYLKADGIVLIDERKESGYDEIR